MHALFTSLAGGNALRRCILEVIVEATVMAVEKRIDLHIMTFAFTDAEIAEALADAAKQFPSLSIRILADFGQRTFKSGQQVGRLAALGLPNLRVRYHHDQPYVWDAERRHVRWSYHASRGLLHHKALCVLVDGQPWRMVCGSFNWTASAAESYENLLLVTSENATARELIARMELEFEALWSDGRASLAPHEARAHFEEIENAYRRNGLLSPSQVGGLDRGEGEVLDALAPVHRQSASRAPAVASADLSCMEPRIEIAFSSRRADAQAPPWGYAAGNRTQRFFLRTPAGTTKRVPLTLTQLSLDTIFQAIAGDTLKIAMYGLSARVPEYGALLEAARRGVRVLAVLDRSVCAGVSARLRRAAAVQKLPVEVRTASRTMHQKYLLNARAQTVLTGTANMSTDSSQRHSEHRIRISGYPELARQFEEDFDEIWRRLAGQKKEESELFSAPSPNSESSEVSEPRQVP